MDLTVLTSIFTQKTQAQNPEEQPLEDINTMLHNLRDCEGSSSPVRESQAVNLPAQHACSHLSRHFPPTLTAVRVPHPLPTCLPCPCSIFLSNKIMENDARLYEYLKQWNIVPISGHSSQAMKCLQSIGYKNTKFEKSSRGNIFLD